MSLTYRFGSFELDANRFELRQRGKCVDIQPKVLRLLLHLVERREQAVATEELLRVLWPDTRVGSGSIKRAILGARQALGVRGEDQAYIRTARGFGYQFVAEVEVEQPGAVSLPPAGPPAPLVRASLRRALLGRERVMELLQENLQQALAGTCRCVLLTGGPGLGKSRTMEELLSEAERLGAEAWIGRCTEIEGAPAFWPFTQIMREALRRRGKAELRTLLGSEGADIAGAFSELRQQWSDLPQATPLSSNSVRFRMYDSMSVFLQRAAEASPIVLALDDLHRADPASLRLLAFIVRHVQQGRILVLGTLRPEVPRSPETAQQLEELKSASSCVALQGLTQEEIARYVQLAIGSEPPAHVSELLHAQTAGNPLFLQHLIESWRATAEHSGTPPWQALSSAPPSQGLAGAIERHLELVSPACRVLLRVAAVLGTDFSSGMLTRVAEQHAADTSAQLAEAIRSGLVRELGGERGGYRFTHVLVRDALYAQLTAALRTSLHFRAGCTLEAQGIGDNAVLLAEVTRHFVRAPAADPERALRYTLRAAELGLRTLAYEQAADHFEVALDLLQYQTTPDPRVRMTLLFRKGEALSRVDMPAARATLFEAAALARELGDTGVLVRAVMVIASRPEAGSVDAAQVAELRRALVSLDEHESDERRPQLQALLAKSLLYDMVPDERANLARAALARAHTLPQAARVEVLTRCHEALPGPEHQRERLGIAKELMKLAVESGDTLALLNAYAAHVETCAERGDMEGVDTAVNSIDVLAERVREPFYRWYTKVVRAMRAFVRGDIQGSDRELHEAWRSAASISAELAEHIYRIQRYVVLRIRGQLEEMEPVIREMMLRFPGVPAWNAAWGALVWDLGQRDAARDCLARIMTRGASRIRSEPAGLANCAALSELCCKVGDAAAAREIYDLLSPYADYHGCSTMGTSTYGPLQRYLATLAECYGEAALAEQHYIAALAAAERMRSPVYKSGTSYLYARMLLQAGDPQQRVQASEQLASALQLADEFQLESIASVSRRLAARHGIRWKQSMSSSA